MVLVELLAVIFVLWLADRRKTAKANKKVAEMPARGEFIAKNYSFFNKAWQDASYDWSGERKMFPKEYWAYFERNDKARAAYIEGLVGQQEMNSGYKPVLCDPYYNKYTFDPFGVFESYKEKIKIFYETGKFYY